MAQEQSLAVHERCLARTSASSRGPRANTQCRHLGQSECQDDGKRGVRGFDGGKLVKGRKRFILVDTLGLLMKVLGTEANIGEREGAEWVLTAVKGHFPRLKLVGVDGGVAGEAFETRMNKECLVKIEVGKPP